VVDGSLVGKAPSPERQYERVNDDGHEQKQETSSDCGKTGTQDAAHPDSLRTVVHHRCPPLWLPQRIGYDWGSGTADHVSTVKTTTPTNARRVVLGLSGVVEPPSPGTDHATRNPRPAV